MRSYNQPRGSAVRFSSTSGHIGIAPRLSRRKVRCRCCGRQRRYCWKPACSSRPVGSSPTRRRTRRGAHAANDTAVPSHDVHVRMHTRLGPIRLRRWWHHCWACGHGRVVDHQRSRRRVMLVTWRRMCLLDVRHRVARVTFQFRPDAFGMCAQRLAADVHPARSASSLAGGLCPGATAVVRSRPGGRSLTPRRPRPAAGSSSGGSVLVIGSPYPAPDLTGRPRLSSADHTLVHGGT
jgi:hypothetical protein